MENLQDSSVYLLGAIGAATIVALYFLFRKDAEAAVPYHIEAPEQTRPGWKGKVLDEPSLKVCLLYKLDYFG